jgi:hypothetical protein
MDRILPLHLIPTVSRSPGYGEQIRHLPMWLQTKLAPAANPALHWLAPKLLATLDNNCADTECGRRTDLAIPPLLKLPMAF